MVQTDKWDLEQTEKWDIIQTLKCDALNWDMVHYLKVRYHTDIEVIYIKVIYGT